jgi:NADH dehydrogenase FAD-containing subunit
MTMGNGGNRRPRVVVVVGGGFAGLSAVRELSGADVDVLLLDRDLHNTFQPLLYQVAAGGLNPGDVTYALRAFAARHGNVRFRRVAVSGVDAARRRVRTDTGEEIQYDYLVEMTDHVLGPFAPRLRSYTAKQLRKRGVSCGWASRSRRSTRTASCSATGSSCRRRRPSGPPA